MDKEIFNLENFPTSESAKRQLKYITAGFYDNSYVGKWIFQVMGQEYDDARKVIEELPAQMFPETATWGLKYHEIKWGLPVRENLSYGERRRLIYAKRDNRAPMTPYRMEKYLEDVTGFEVHIADVHDPGNYGFTAPHPNVFKAYFLGEETLDSKIVRRILGRLKQSHTTYSICERIEAVFDNRELEQIILRNIRFKIGLPFWYEYVFNGGWLLDGSVMLDNKRRYALAVDIIYRFILDAMMGSMKLQALRTGLKQYTYESAAARVIYSFAVDSGRGLKHKEKMSLDLHAGLDFSRHGTVELTVETKSRDHWLLNGSFNLDGARNLDSVYRQEVIE